MARAGRRPLPAFLISYSNSDFTNPHEAVLPDEPENRRGAFTHMGAKYWGFETRRHRATAVLAREEALRYDHDAFHWLRLGLKARAAVDRLAVSTKWFTGNQVRALSVVLIDGLTGRERRVVERQALKPDSERIFRFSPVPATECLLECYHEGGLARVSLFGSPAEEQPSARPNLLEGARITHVSNAHYGKPEQAVRGERRETHMVGWESARTGFGERALFHLRSPAVIERIVVDTYLHRLNPPLTAHVFGADAKGRSAAALMKRAPRWKLVFESGKEVVPPDFQAYMLAKRYLAGGRRFKIKLHLGTGSPWRPILPFAALSPDTYHRFDAPADVGAVTHLLYMHYPNGGIHGLKAYGRVSSR